MQYLNLGIFIEYLQTFYAFSFLFIAFSLLLLIHYKKYKVHISWYSLLGWSFFYGMHEIIDFFFALHGLEQLQKLSYVFQIFSLIFLLLFFFRSNGFFERNNFKILFNFFVFLGLIFLLFSSHFNYFLPDYLIKFMFLVGSLGTAYVFYIKGYRLSDLKKLKNIYIWLSFLFILYGLSSMLEIKEIFSYGLNIKLFVKLARSLISFSVSILFINLIIEFILGSFIPQYYKIIKRYIVFGIIVFFIVFFVGYIYVGDIMKKHYDSMEKIGKTELEIISKNVNTNIEYYSGLASIISQLDEVKNAFLAKSVGLKSANRVIDLFKKESGLSVVYLMDKDGTVIASTNRGEKTSFVGKNYGFRPYFKDAIEGGRGLYFAKGATSGKRGMFSSAPVFASSSREVIGVIVIKNGEESIHNMVIQNKYSALISPLGVIFASSHKDMVLKFLFTVGKEEKDLVSKSRQFGDEELFSLKFIKEEKNVLLSPDGKEYLYREKVITDDGWKAVFIMPHNHLEHDKSIAFIRLIYISLGVLIIYFVALKYLVDTLLIQISELKYRDIFENASDLIQSIGSCGNIIFVNTAWKNALGYSDSEISKMNIFDVIHQKDKKKCMEIFNNLKKTKSIEGIITRFVAKDGKVIWVEGNVTTRKLSDQSFINRGIFRDITKQKKSEEKEKEKNSQLELMNNISVDRELKMLDLKKKIKKLEYKINKKNV